MRRIQRKPSGWEHLFEVPGYAWEDQTDSLKAIHITVKGVKHVVIYAYNASSEFNVATYIEGRYSDVSNEQWLGPMEALCLALEVLKEASIQPTSNSAT